MFLWTCLKYTIAHYDVPPKQFINKQFSFRSQTLRSSAVSKRKAETRLGIKWHLVKTNLFSSEKKIHFRVCREILETRDRGLGGITRLKIYHLTLKIWNHTKIAHKNLMFVSFPTAVRNSTAQARIVIKNVVINPFISTNNLEENRLLAKLLNCCDMQVL